MTDCRLICGDCALVLPSLAADSFDSIVTDPPAGIAFMNKAWDKDKGGRDSWIDWMTGIAAECLRVAKPGAHALVWSLPRTSHWTATAWEDAGWEVRDRIGYLFGTGFPKSMNLGDGIGTALKPACEDWWLLRKPIYKLVGTVANNVKAFGTGGLNIDACRIGADSNDPNKRSTPSSASPGLFGVTGHSGTLNTGRWPANIAHDGSDEVLAVFPDTSPSKATVRHNGHFQSTAKGKDLAHDSFGHADDGGSAARFFFCSKASRSDREEGLDDFEARQMDESRDEDAPGANNPRNRGGEGRKNHHPTVKSTRLMRWLVRLVTPVNGTVLDPFAGSGSTGKACALEDRGFVGIEQDPEFVAIAEARIAWARKHLRIEQLSMFSEARP